MTRVLLTWERRPSQPVADAVRGVVRGVVERLGGEASEVHVLFTGDERIRELNRLWRSRDAATDVLSFPDGDELPDGGRLLGEIVISVDTARRQAIGQGHDERRELLELALHGTLHLLGYDHVSDEGDMDRLELKLRRELLP